MIKYKMWSSHVIVVFASTSCPFIARLWRNMGQDDVDADEVFRWCPPVLGREPSSFSPKAAQLPGQGTTRSWLGETPS